MGGDALPLQPGHQQVAHPVVDDPFAHDSPLFLPVEGRGVVFIGDDEQIGVLGGIYLLCLALVQQLVFFHSSPSCKNPQFALAHFPRRKAL